MSEDTPNKQNETLVDLSELSNIEFATAWTPSSNFDNSTTVEFRAKGSKKPFNKKSSKKDFSEKRKPRKTNQDAKFKKKPFKKFAKNSDKKKTFAPFNFTMDVQIFPEDAPFNKLGEIIKASKRTYQLFDIAQLILEKRERMVILAKNLPDSDNIVKPLFCAQPFNIPFEDEQSARNAALDYYFKEMFVSEEVEAEAPKGSFTVINRCKLSGDLLGAPNWHKYNEYVREYQKNKYPKMSMESFLETVESVKGDENVNAWLEQMKTRKVYKLKDTQENEEVVFETSDAAKSYIAQKKADDLVKVYEQVRMGASNIENMPFGRIRRNIEEAINKEKRFPINTANNMRGKLRRFGFAVYKRGSKGFAFVSTIKRKFLFEGEKLSDVPQKIFDFVLLNPAVKMGEVPYKMLGIDLPAEMSSTDVPENDATIAEPIAPETLTAEQKEQFNTIYSELMWLISEGYVVEYYDTTLQANPYLPKPKEKSAETEVEPIADEPVTQTTDVVEETPAEVEGVTETEETTSTSEAEIAEDTSKSE